jgi:hypothetical protein
MELLCVQIHEQQVAQSLETKTARRFTTLLQTSFAAVLELPLIVIMSQVSSCDKTREITFKR